MSSLVFSQWTALLDLLEPFFIPLGITYSRLDGSAINRVEVIEGFQNRRFPSVMLISLKAGGVGVTLTTADRAHRIEQTNPVFIQRLVAQNTIE